MSQALGDSDEQDIVSVLFNSHSTGNPEDREENYTTNIY